MLASLTSTHLPGDLFPVGVTTGSERLVSPTGGNAGRVLVDTTTSPASATLAKVTVQIEWRSRAGGTTNVMEMTTYVADRT